MTLEAPPGGVLSTSPHAAHTRNLNFVPDKLLELRIARNLFLRAISFVEEVSPTGSLRAPLSYYRLASAPPGCAASACEAAGLACTEKTIVRNADQIFHGSA